MNGRSAQRCRAGGRARACRARNSTPPKRCACTVTPSHDADLPLDPRADILHPCRSTSASASCRRKRHIVAPRQRDAPHRGGDGLRGLLGPRVDPLPPPVAVPRDRVRRVRADRARGVGARRARAPAPAHVGRAARRRRGHRPPAADVEQRRRDLARAPDRRDGLLLPERRGRRGDLRPRGLAARSRRSSATCRTSPATTSSSRAAPRIASARRASSATSSSRRPG